MEGMTERIITHSSLVYLRYTSPDPIGTRSGTTKGSKSVHQRSRERRVGVKKGRRITLPRRRFSDRWTTIRKSELISSLDL